MAKVKYLGKRHKVLKTGHIYEAEKRFGGDWLITEQEHSFLIYRFACLEIKEKINKSDK